MIFLRIKGSLTLAGHDAAMPAAHGHLFPLCLRLHIGGEVHELCIDRDDRLCRLRGFRGLAELRVTNLAPILAASATILSRDRIVRRMIEAELGPARNSFLTPRLGMIELCLSFDAALEPARSWTAHGPRDHYPLWVPPPRPCPDPRFRP